MLVAIKKLKDKLFKAFIKVKYYYKKAFYTLET